MKTDSVPMKLVRALAFLGALFAVGAVTGRLVSAPPALLGTGLVALALRIWVMLAAADESAEAPSPARVAREADVRPLRAANG